MPAWFYSDWSAIVRPKWRLFFVIAPFMMISQHHSFWCGLLTQNQSPDMNCHELSLVNISNSWYFCHPTGTSTASLCVQTVQCHHYFCGTSTSEWADWGSPYQSQMTCHVRHVNIFGWRAYLALGSQCVPYWYPMIWLQFLGFHEKTHHLGAGFRPSKVLYRRKLKQQ